MIAVRQDLSQRRRDFRYCSQKSGIFGRLPNVPVLVAALTLVSKATVSVR